MAHLDSFKVGLHLFGIGELEGTWKPDDAERRAAWEMYVELVTRISVVELQADEGLLREALSSLYALMDITRKVLKQYGPDIARPKDGGSISFGYLAVLILNGVVRPVLAKWHPLLLDYESTRAEAVSRIAHEQQWSRSSELRTVLNDARLVLVEYAEILAQVAEVPSLITPPTQ